MHMSDALISPVVGGVMWAATAGTMVYSIKKTAKEELFESGKIPLMGVMGAFVFAAQMINFTIPGTGSSGHICGAVILSAMLGPSAGLLTMAVILAIQALFFADGGLLALGANIFNMGALTCLAAYPLIFRPLLRKAVTPGRIAAASVLTSIVGLQLGSFAVVLETQLSGLTELPFAAFTALMQPIHLAIGLGEGLVTAALLIFLNKVSPESLTDARSLSKRAVPSRVLVGIAVLAVLCGGALSLLASGSPDGLEWSTGALAGELSPGGSGAHTAAAALQDQTALMPDYSLDAVSGGGTSVAGVVGSLLTLGLAALAGLLLYIPRRKKRRVP